MRPMPKWWLIVLAVAIVLLAVVGVASLGAFFLTREQPFAVPAWQDPLTQLNADGIDAALAVGGLGGVPDSDLVATALAQARSDIAFVGLLFSLPIGDQVSSGFFLLLAKQY